MRSGLTVEGRIGTVFAVLLGSWLTLVCCFGEVAAAMEGDARGGMKMPHPPTMGHSPAGLAGDSLHHAGKWMLTYRYMYMYMDGNRDGTDGLTTAEVLQDFAVAPERMSMQMHMLGLMYGVNHTLTLMAMVLYALPGCGTHRFHLNAGLSFPTGSVGERGRRPWGRT